MADKDASKDRTAWGLARRLSAIYGLATTVGFFYASAYFGHFDIDILNFVAPIDFIFISLEHIDRVIFIAIVLMPLAILLLAGGVPAAILSVLSFTVAFVTFAVAVILMSFVTLIFLIVALLAIVRAPAIRFYWLKNAVSAILDERAADVSTGGEQDRQRFWGGRAALPRMTAIADTYRQARSKGRPVWGLDPDNIRTQAENILGIVPSTWSWAAKVIQAAWNGMLSAKSWIGESYLGRTTAAASEEMEDEEGAEDPRRSGRIRLKSWDELTWPARFAAIGGGSLLLALLISAAVRVGQVDAIYFEKDDEACALDVLELDLDLVCYAEEVIRPLTAFFGDDRPADPRSAKENLRAALGCGVDQRSEQLSKVFSIPNTNLASLEFSNCIDASCPRSSRSPRKYARPHFRHDAGDDTRRGTPDCLAYLGATGSMQFLAQFKGDREVERKPIDPDSTVVIYEAEGRTPTVPIPAGGSQTWIVVLKGEAEQVVIGTNSCEKVAVVGPFESGSHDGLDEYAVDGCLNSTVPDACGVCGEALLSSVGELERRIEELGRRMSRGSPERLVLIGRVDSLPIHTDDYRSNFALAQARANWVSEQFADADWAKDAHVMAIPGGPANPHVDPCDRIVEVHMCWAPPEGEPGVAAVGTVDAGTGRSRGPRSSDDDGER